MPRGRVPGELGAEARRLLLSGQLVRAVSEKVGLSKVTIYRIRAQVLLEGKQIAPCSCGLLGQHKGGCRKQGAAAKKEEGEGEAQEAYVNPLLAQVPGSSIPPPGRARLMAGR